MTKTDPRQLPKVISVVTNMQTGKNMKMKLIWNEYEKNTENQIKWYSAMKTLHWRVKVDIFLSLHLDLLFWLGHRNLLMMVMEQLLTQSNWDISDEFNRHNCISLPVDVGESNWEGIVAELCLLIMSIFVRIPC